MSEKLDIKKSDIISHIESTWSTYASQTYRGNRLLFRVRLDGMFKVQYDGAVLYRGVSLVKAISAWEEV